MPNVLMIGPDPSARGGMAAVERNILNAIRARGDRAEFILTFVEGGKPKKLVVAAAAFCRYLHLLSKVDLVHVHMASRGSYERKRVFMNTAFRHGVPVVLHLHGSEFGVWFSRECTESKRNEIRNTFSMCAKVVVLSEEWRDFFIGNGICESGKVTVLHNAVYIPEDNAIDYANSQILFLGRLGERKSPGTLLHAAKLVLEKHQDATFVFGGDGDIEGYRKLSSQLGVDASCHFVGWVTGGDKERLFAESSVYCLPSKNEGMPMSVLEAMAHGLATVATPVGGVHQVIIDGSDGIIIPVGKPDALAKALCALLDDIDMKRRIGQAGREKVKERFSMSTYLDKLFEIYAEVIR